MTLFPRYPTIILLICLVICLSAIHNLSENLKTRKRKNSDINLFVCVSVFSFAFERKGTLITEYDNQSRINQWNPDRYLGHPGSSPGQVFCANRRQFRKTLVHLPGESIPTFCRGKIKIYYAFGLIRFLETN